MWAFYLHEANTASRLLLGMMVPDLMEDMQIPGFVLKSIMNVEGELILRVDITPKNALVDSQMEEAESWPPQLDVLRSGFFFWPLTKFNLKELRLLQDKEYDIL